MQTIKHFFKKLYHTIHLTTPVAILIGALMISISHLSYATIISNSTTGKPVDTFKGRAVDASDLAIGKTNSDVIVIEYSDTECPFCAQLHPTIKKIQDEYASKVSFVYRYFPLTQIHPHAFDEARSIFCVGKVAGAQKRMDYINEMFTYKISKQNMVLPPNGAESLVKNIGVDLPTFTSCMQGPDGAEAVNKSMQDGIAAGVEGTPATFILTKKRGGYEVVSLVSGARQYEFFKTAIDEALAR